MELSFVIKSIAYLIGVYQRKKHPQQLKPWECPLLMALLEECPDSWINLITDYYRAGTKEE